MSRFREFLQDEPVFIELNAPNFMGGTNYAGPLNMPDMSVGNIYNPPGEIPAGGFSSIQQATQSQIDKRRYGELGLHHTAQTLQKLAALANNVVIIDQMNDPAQARMTMRYKLAQYHKDKQLITGMTIRGLTSDGGYPEVRPADIDIAYDLKIIIPDPYPPDPAMIQQSGMGGQDFYAIDINRLRSAMEKHREDMGTQERGYKAINYVAGTADQALKAAMSGGRIPISKSVNPFSGG